MQGQSNHFNRYAPEDIPYAKKRKYLFMLFGTASNASHRLLGRDQALVRRAGDPSPREGLPRWAWTGCLQHRRHQRPSLGANSLLRRC